MKKEALVSRETVVRLTERLKIESVVQVRFEISRISKYKKSFRELVIEGKAKGNFEDDNWVLKTIKNSKANFNFFLINLESYKLPLKGYVLEKISNGIDTVTTQSDLKYIKDVLELTKGFKDIGELEEYIAKQGYRKQTKMASAIIEFLNFYWISTRDEVIDVCSQFTYNERKVRELPKFDDVLMFDDILESFFSNCSKEEKLMYYPIILWWKITKIIPLRPDEFYSLSWNCISEVNNTYWITLPRKKQLPQNNEEIEITNEIEINSDIFNLILDYKNLINYYLKPENKPEYLLSIKIYQIYFGKRNKVYKSDQIDGSKFIIMLEVFYRNIVEKRFNTRNLEKVKPGDTRHFAFCNMMLQGFNMLSIARIGGHKTLKQQLHYHSHLDHFADSAVYILARSHYGRVKMKTFESLNREVEIKSKIYQLGDFKEHFPVDYGYCTDNPIRCRIGDCKYCEHYFFSPSEDRKIEGLKWLRDSSEALGQRIKEQINFMISISKNMEYNLKTLQYPLYKQEQLSTNATSLKSLMNQKAMIDSILLEE